MTVQETFDRLDRLSRLIPAWETHIASYRDALGISAPSPDSEYVSHTKNVHVMGDKVAALIDAETELSAMKKEQSALKATILRWIGLLEEPQEVSFMAERYITGKSNQEIANSHGRSMRCVQMALRSARIHIEKSLENGP